jgi:hypothetical protein
MAESGEELTCFMAMPITTHPDHAKVYGGDQEHWEHVMSTLFEKAIKQAGFKPIRPAADGANLIHGLIIQNLSSADLVLVDLSTHNPNVFFELGVRTSIDRPIALVRDEHTTLPFDISGINAYRYDSNLLAWELDRAQEDLAAHIRSSYESCDGHNPLWRKFGLTIKASEPDANESPLEAKVDLIAGHLAQIQNKLESSGPGRFSPSERFIQALRKQMLDHPPAGRLDISVSGPDVVEIAADGDGDGVARIQDLAAQCDTRVVWRLVDKVNEAAAVPGGVHSNESESRSLADANRRLAAAKRREDARSERLKRGDFP